MDTNTGHRPKRQGQRHDSQLETRIIKDSAFVSRTGHDIRCFPCTFCSKKFKSEESVRSHERDYHTKRLKKYLSSLEEKDEDSIKVGLVKDKTGKTWLVKVS